MLWVVKIKYARELGKKKKYIGGEYTFDANFQKGPKVFKEFALNLWNINIMQKWDDDQ